MYLDSLITRYPALSPLRGDIWNAFIMMRDCYRIDGKLLIAGNGGSAADGEHIAGELMKSFMLPRPLDEDIKKCMRESASEYGFRLADCLRKALPAIALTGHTPLATAIANDVGPEMVFAQQLYGYGKQGDVFLAISTSGSAANVLYAAAAAKALGIKVIGLTGKNGGKLNGLADIMVRVPETEAYLVQEAHMPVYHCWCAMLEEFFFKGGQGDGALI